MPARSKIDVHPERAGIERDLALGIPLRRVAKKYRVSIDCCFRHRKKLPPQLKAALAARALAPGEDLEAIKTEQSEGLLAKLAAQQARLLLAQDAALESEQLSVVCMLSGQIHRNLELVGKYLGEFARHQTTTTTHLLIAPEYLQLRSALVQCLAPFPEARQAVSAALHRLEAPAVTIDAAA